jgi:hypothetical protein
VQGLKDFLEKGCVLDMTLLVISCFFELFFGAQEGEIKLLNYHVQDRCNVEERLSINVDLCECKVVPVCC